MGNEKSVFRNATIQPQPFHTCRDHSMHDCTHSSRRYTLFQLNDNVDASKLKVRSSLTSKNNPSLTIILNLTDSLLVQSQSWKSIRHPHILRYFECIDWKGRTCVICEPVQPLSLLHNNLTSDEIICGLSQVCEALSFLHERCSLSHKHLTLDSIFVSMSNHSWKLGMLQSVEPNKDRNQAHIVDMPSLATLIRQLLGDRSTCQLPTFLSQLETQSNVACTPKAADLLQDPLFRHCDYLQIVHFIEHFASFDEPTVEEFFDTIVARLRSLPPEVLSQKLIPLLLTSRFVMLHPTADIKLLPYLFSCTPTQVVEEPLLNVKQFKSYIVPLICKLFCVRKVQIRLILLRYLSLYARHIDPSTITGQLLPQIWLAEKDENDDLVAETFVAVGQLVRIHGASIILGERKKCFSNIIPKGKRLPDDSLPSNHLLSTSQSSCAGDSIADSSAIEESTMDRLNRSDELTMENGIESDGKSKEQISSTLNQAAKTIRMMSLVRDPKPPVAFQAIESALTDLTTSDVKTLATELRGKTVNKVNAVDLESDIKALKIEPKMDEIDQLFSDMKPKVKFKKSHDFTPKESATKLNAKFSVEQTYQDDDSGAGWGIEEDEEEDDDDDEGEEANQENALCFDLSKEGKNIRVN
jgi:serine/threonine protein kinase